jgi:GTPase SAR1 family protein
MASQYGAMCLELSAKTGEGVNEMFEAATRKILEKHSDLLA